ncbi:hypothetical protein [Massilia sp. erpn]|uniref:hypothetical protein n=1 Tax=Massilia sp. erpn TaxID=2738142 RepID=UPI0021055AFA|nr:hypothetical protein [Massilia sp. erpn]UTY59308.1 hypothetical protein HPQ68_20290 [Massilia sp. erpn]
MTVNLEQMGRAGETPASHARRQPQARQERWLYELEHAMLQQEQKKPRQAPPLQAPVPLRADMAPAAATEPALTAARGRDGMTPARPDMPAASAAPVTAAAAAAGEPVSGAACAMAADSPAGAVPGSAAPAHGEAGVEPGHGATDAVQAPHGTLAQAVLPNGAVLAAAASARPAAAVAALEGVASAAAAQPMVAGAERLSLPFGAPAEAEPAPAPAQAEPPEPDEAAATGSRAEQDYRAQQLHVYQDAQGVQAWVRDAGLSAAQALGLAQAMAGELAGSGARLTALTLNGKKLLENASVAAGGDAFVAAVPAAPAFLPIDAKGPL